MKYSPWQVIKECAGVFVQNTDDDSTESELSGKHIGLKRMYNAQQKQYIRPTVRYAAVLSICLLCIYFGSVKHLSDIRLSLP